MIISESPSFSGASWEAYSTSKNWTLSSGEGEKTIYGAFRDELLESSASINDSIIYNNTGPTANFTFPSATYYSPSTWSTILGVASDVISGVASTTLTIQRDSDNNYWDGSTWQSSSTNLATSGTPTAWSYDLSLSNLDNGIAYTTIANSTDNASNTSSTSQTFIYDNTAPTTTTSLSSGTFKTAQTVTLSATDDLSGVATTYYTTDGSDPTTSSTQYTNAITISQDTILKFFSTDIAGNSESIQTENYIITTVPYKNKIKLKLSYKNKTLASKKNKISLTFTKLPKKPAKYWIRTKKVNKYAKNFKPKSKTLKYYYKITTNLNKYKKKIKVKIFFKFTKKKLKKRKLKKKNLYLIKYNHKKKQWTKVKKAKLQKKNKQIKLTLKKFKKKTTKYAIVSK